MHENAWCEIGKMPENCMCASLNCKQPCLLTYCWWKKILWLGLWPWKFPNFLETGEHLSHWFQSERPCSQSRFWKPQCSTRHFELNNPLWCVVSVYVLSFNPALLFADISWRWVHGVPIISSTCLDCFGRLNPNNFAKWHREVAQKNNFYIFPKFPGVLGWWRNTWFTNLLEFASQWDSFSLSLRTFSNTKTNRNRVSMRLTHWWKMLGDCSMLFCFLVENQKKSHPTFRPRSPMFFSKRRGSQYYVINDSMATGGSFS